MPKSEQIHIQKHVSLEEFNKKIRSERDERILKRLYFVKYRYEKKAKKCDIELVYLPVYSPHLNPIEYIWKSIKRTISKNFIKSQNHMKRLIRVNFLKYASRISFAKSWIE